MSPGWGLASYFSLPSPYLLLDTENFIYICVCVELVHGKKLKFFMWIHMLYAGLHAKNFNTGRCLPNFPDFFYGLKLFSFISPSFSSSSSSSCLFFSLSLSLLVWFSYNLISSPLLPLSSRKKIQYCTCACVGAVVMPRPRAGWLGERGRGEERTGGEEDGGTKR